MTQHNPQFIKEMESKLLAEKRELEEQIALNQDFPDYGRNDEDNVTEVADFQASAATENVLEERLESINAALLRMEEGTYGITENGEVIPEARLRANPAADTLVSS